MEKATRRPAPVAVGPGQPPEPAAAEAPATTQTPSAAQATAAAAQPPSAAQAAAAAQATANTQASAAADPGNTAPPPAGPRERLPRVDVAVATPARWLDGYLGALWLLAALVPGLMAVIAVGLYLLSPGWPGPDAVVAGAVSSVVAWLVAGVFVRPMTSARAVQGRVHTELMQRLQVLTDRLRGVAPQSDAAQTAVEEAAEQLQYAKDLLAGPGSGPSLRWALANGYIGALRSLHRAEEALIVAQNEEATIADALHDALSLEGSTVANRDRLAGVLRAAVDRMDQGAAAAFLAPAPRPAQAAGAQLSIEAAREALREVRHTINDFRDDRQDGLIRARNRLVVTMLAVGLATYLLLGLALFVGVPRANAAAAGAFYLVGGIVGLFNRLRIESGRSSAVEDFGLFQARLITIPLVSGLAAVGGVYLLSQAPSLISGGTATVVDGATSLGRVFDLSANQLGLLVAAVFGLAPGALSAGLQGQAERLEHDLQSSEPAATSDSPPTGPKSG